MKRLLFVVCGFVTLYCMPSIASAPKDKDADVKGTAEVAGVVAAHANTQGAAATVSVTDKRAQELAQVSALLKRRKGTIQHSQGYHNPIERLDIELQGFNYYDPELSDRTPMHYRTAGYHFENCIYDAEKGIYHTEKRIYHVYIPKIESWEKHPLEELTPAGYESEKCGCFGPLGWGLRGVHTHHTPDHKHFDPLL